MRCTRVFVLIAFVSVLMGNAVLAQQVDADQQRLEDLFKKANALSEQKNYAEAVKLYREALKLAPDSEPVLFNAALTSYLIDDFRSAAELWERLAKIAPDDWSVESKLVQAYQALGDRNARDAHRTKLFEMRKSGVSPELSKRDSYCREQFKVNGVGVFVLEHFEMKGDRARKYEFIVLNNESKEDYTISLGSYAVTNSIWAEQNKKEAATGQRLFHLDGYYKWGHATYGFYTPEPTYDAVRQDVVKVLEDKLKPASSTTLTPKGADVVIKK